MAQIQPARTPAHLAPPRKGPGRYPVVQDRIIEHLRGSILRGELAPGAQVPTRAKLETRFRCSSLTVHRALGRLHSDGYVVSRGRAGTFVVDRPPHLYHFGLVFAGSPKTGWNLFWQTLDRAAERLAKGQEWRLSRYYGCGDTPLAGDYSRLLQDVLAHRLAGLFFASAPFLLQGSPVLLVPDLPRVAIMSNPVKAQVLGLELDTLNFVTRGVAHLAARGRRKLAVIAAPGVPGSDWEVNLHKAVAANGMETRPAWLHVQHLNRGPWHQHLIALLFSVAPADRPDALLICDDNLVQGACDGLIAAGVRVPQDVDVVAHCNFPPPSAPQLPARRLGFAAPEILACGIKLLQQCRDGVALSATNHVPARFEDEVDANGSPQ